VHGIKRPPATDPGIAEKRGVASSATGTIVQAVVPNLVAIEFVAEDQTEKTGQGNSLG
jgi:hypothetical protein